MLGSIEYILLHDSSNFAIGWEWIDAVIFILNYLCNPSVNWSIAYSVIGKKSNSVCNFITDTVEVFEFENKIFI